MSKGLYCGTHYDNEIFFPSVGGEVVKVGKGVTAVNVGDIVNSDSHLVCNSCDLCLNGHTDVCYNTVVIGVHRDGAMAEYISIPESAAVKCDPSMPIEQLALMEPLGVAVHAAMEFPISAKKVAAVRLGAWGLRLQGRWGRQK